MYTLPDLARSIATEFRRSLRPLIGFAILFGILQAAAITPALWWGMKQLIATGGGYPISNESIPGFLLSPAGFLLVAIAGTMSLAILLGQKAGVLVLGTERMGVFGALLTIVRTSPRLIRLGFLQFSLTVLACLPGAAVILVIWLLFFSENDINYYLATMPPAFRAGLLVAGALLVGNAIIAGVLYVRWCLSLPLLMYEDRGARQSLRGSAELVRGSFWTIAALMGGWLLLMFLASSALTVGLNLLARWLAGMVGDDLTVVLLLVGGYLILQVALITAIAFTWFNVHCLLINHLYREACRRHGVAAPEASEQVSDERIDDKQRRNFWLTVTAVVAVLVGPTLFAAYEFLADLESATDRPVTVTAHRGSSREAPENSLSAIEKAIGAGADLAEIDVQEMRDGTIVVLHDTDLMRIAGLQKKIWDLDYSQIEQLDAGSWFSPEFAGEKIPTLRKAIGVAHGRIKLNIELKFHGHEQRFVERVLSIIQEEGFESDCVITSLSEEGLREVKRLNDRLEVGFIVGAAIGDLRRLPADFLSLELGQVDERLVGGLHARKKAVHVWTVNDPKDMHRMITIGVDSLITDEPRTAVTLVRQFREMSPAERLLVEFKNLFLD